MPSLREGTRAEPAGPTRPPRFQTPFVPLFRTKSFPASTGHRAVQANGESTLTGR